LADRADMEDWFAVINSAPGYKKWQGSTVLLDCSVKIVEADEFLYNQPSMVMEKQFGKLYVGWVEVTDLDIGVNLTDASGNLAVENLDFEYAHPSIGYLFNTSFFYTGNIT
jgi:hypothetical protein